MKTHLGINNQPSPRHDPSLSLNYMYSKAMSCELQAIFISKPRPVLLNACILNMIKQQYQGSAFVHCFGRLREAARGHGM